MKRLLKKSTAMISVKIGVAEFNIPARELETWVCAFVKRKAGMPLPIMPTMIRYIRFSFETLFRRIMITGSRITNEKNILKAATWLLLKELRPFFISMKEVPQIIEMKIKSVHCQVFFVRSIGENLHKDMYINGGHYPDGLIFLIPEKTLIPKRLKRKL
jgi:hypothetical protein